MDITDTLVYGEQRFRLHSSFQRKEFQELQSIAANYTIRVFLGCMLWIGASSFPVCLYWKVDYIE